MLLLTEKIRKLDLGWNERTLDEGDFHNICRRFKISVTDMPLRVSGFYYQGIGRRTRQETEADAFALCAVIPLSCLKSAEQSFLDGFPESMISERLELLERFNI